MKTLLIFWLTLSCYAIQGQSRYLDSLFSVEISPDITYGSNSNVNGDFQSLEMDIYEPVGDTAPSRPLIIFAHGGFFLAGSKENPTMVALCVKFAQMGYLTASIEYRLGVNYFNVITGLGEEEFTYAVMRASHDMRAAVRFFKQDAATTNTYRVDTNNIVVGGSSAGAFTALHLAYMDTYNELAERIPDIQAYGGVAGNSGNAGYNSDAGIIVNLCGALGDTSWIQPGDEALVSIHGDQDETVPYAVDTVFLFGIPVGEVMGSYTIAQRANHIELEHELKTFYGQGHVPYEVSSPSPEQQAYFDTTVNVVKWFLYHHLDNAFMNIENVMQPEQQSLILYPNPARQTLFAKPIKEDVGTLTVLNALGQTITTCTQYDLENGLPVMLLEPGIYFIKQKTKLLKFIKN